MRESYFLSGRHFYRCPDCAHVFALELEAIGPFQRREEVRCDCGARAHWMGRVERNRVLKIGERCPCDSRCTHALGGNCDCVCGGVNHGTGRVVRYVRDNGAAIIAPQASLEQRRVAVAAWKAAEAAALRRVDAATGGALSQLQRGERVEPYSLWIRVRELTAAVRKASKLVSVKSRIAKLETIAS